MKPSRYLFTSLMLLALGLSGCSKSEEDISSSDITSFAEQSSPTTVAELTRQLRAYNASLGMAETSVVFNEATDCTAKLQLSSVSSNVPTMEYTVSKGIQTYDIPTSELKNGVYQVSLVENGHVIDTKKFVK